MTGAVDLRVMLQGEPPTGHVTRERDGAGRTFVGWGGLLRAVSELAGTGDEGGESATS